MRMSSSYPRPYVSSILESDREAQHPPTHAKKKKKTHATKHDKHQHPRSHEKHVVLRHRWTKTKKRSARLGLEHAPSERTGRRYCRSNPTLRWAARTLRGTAPRHKRIGFCLNRAWLAESLPTTMLAPLSSTSKTNPALTCCVTTGPSSPATNSWEFPRCSVRLSWSTKRGRTRRCGSPRAPPLHPC